MFKALEESSWLTSAARVMVVPSVSDLLYPERLHNILDWIFGVLETDTIEYPSISPPSP